MTGVTASKSKAALAVLQVFSKIQSELGREHPELSLQTVNHGLETQTFLLMVTAPKF